MFKPLRGTRLNFSHPLARHVIHAVLFNEATGTKVFIHGIDQGIGTLQGITVLPEWTPDGLYMKSSGGSYQRVVLNTTYYPSSAANFQQSWFFLYDYKGNPGHYQTAWTKGFDWDSNHLLELGINSSNLWEIARTGGSIQFNGYTPSAGRNLSAGLNFLGSGVYPTAVFDGDVKITAGSTLSAAGDVANPISLGWGDTDYDEPMNAVLKVYYWFNRPLTDEEFKSLHANPYQLFEYQSPGFKIWGGQQLIPSNYTGNQVVSQKPTISFNKIDTSHPMAHGMRAGYIFNSNTAVYGTAINRRTNNSLSETAAEINDIVGNAHLVICGNSGGNYPGAFAGRFGTEIGAIGSGNSRGWFRTVDYGNIATPAPVNLDGATGITLIAMIRTPPFAWIYGDTRIISKQTTYLEAGHHWMLGLYGADVQSNATLRSRLRIGGSVTALIGNINGGSGWYEDSSNQEYLVCAVTYDGTTERLWICNLEGDPGGTSPTNRMTQIGSQSRSGTIGDNCIYPLNLGASINSGSYDNNLAEHRYVWAYIYDRALSEEEMNSLIFNPYQMLNRPSVSRFMQAILSGDINLSGLMGTASSLSGLLNAIRSFSGTVTTVANVDSGVNINRQISGTINSVSDLTLDNLYNLISLSGQINGQSVLSSELYRIINPTGTFFSISDLSADMYRIINLTGTSASLSGISSLLSVIRPQSGTISAVSSFASLLNILMGVSGTINSISSISSDLNINRSISGTINTSSDVSSLLSAIRSQSGTMNAVSSLTADLYRLIGLTGSSSIISDLASLLNIDRSFAGTINTQSELDGIIERINSLSGTINSVSDLEGILTVIGSGIVLSGVINTVSSLTALIKSTRPFTGSSGSVSDLVSGLTVERVFAGAINTQSDLDGFLTNTIGLSGVISQVSYLVATLKSTIDFSGTIDSVSALSSILNINRGLSGTADPAAQLQADLEIARLISGAINAVSSLTASEIFVEEFFREVLNLSSLITNTLNTSSTITTLIDNDSAITVLEELDSAVTILLDKLSPLNNG